MTNILGPITIIVLLCAGYLAMQNKKAYEIEIENTRNERHGLKLQQDRLQKANDELAATTAKRIETQEKNVELTATEAAQQQKNQDLKATVESKIRQTETNKQELDEIREKTAKAGDLRELADKMRATKADLNQLAVDIDEKEQQRAQLIADNQQTEGRIGNMRDMFETISKSQSLPTLNTRIRSIYPSWGFVTLASGNDAGVVMNSFLDVVRDGTTIAKLIVTAVERNSASANIVPDSISQDVTLMVGDRVMPSAPNAAPATQPN